MILPEFFTHGNKRTESASKTDRNPKLLKPKQSSSKLPYPNIPAVFRGYLACAVYAIRLAQGFSLYMMSDLLIYIFRRGVWTKTADKYENPKLNQICSRYTNN